MVDFVIFHNSQHPDFTAVIDIYQKAFPVSERIPVPLIEARVNSTDYQLFVGYQKSQVIFMAILCHIADTKFILLAYIATKESFRNQGIGSEFFDYILPKLKQEKKYLLLEVENPQYGENQELRNRRLNFYRRMGAQQLKEVRFATPPLEGNLPVEMLLMIAPHFPEKILSGKIVKKIITWLFVEGYRGSPHSTLLAELIKSVDSIVELI